VEEDDSDDDDKDDKVTAHKRFLTISRSHTLLTLGQRTLTRESIKRPHGQRRSAAPGAQRAGRPRA
jgi:hypothetical protein